MYACTHGRTDRLTDGWTHDRHNAMTVARWPSASGANNHQTLLKLLPNDVILDLSKLKAFAAYNFNEAEMLIFLSDRIENMAGKGEKCCTIFKILKFIK